MKFEQRNLFGGEGLELCGDFAGSGRPGPGRVQGQPHALSAGTLVSLPLGHSLELHNGAEEWLSYFIVKA